MVQRFFNRLLHLVWSAAGTNRHQGTATTGHNILDVREIDVDQAGFGYQFGNSLDTLPQNIVCQGKSHLKRKVAGSDLEHVLKATIFVTDLAHFATVNEVYGAHVSRERPPARATVQVAALPRGAQVEIEVVAAVK